MLILLDDYESLDCIQSQGGFCTLLCHQAERCSLQVHSSGTTLVSRSQNFLAGRTPAWSEQTSEAHNLSGKEKRGRAKSRKIRVEDTHETQAVLQCLNPVFNTMKIGGLQGQPCCRAAMCLDEPLSLCIIITPPFMWALYRPQNSILLHICFR